MNPGMGEGVGFGLAAWFEAGFGALFDRFALDLPWLLLLLPLALLPWLASPGEAPRRNAWSALAPADAASRALALGLRALGSLAIAALVVGVAGPHRREVQVERVGRGAEIVLLLDRSRSMDQPFGGAAAAGAAARGTGPEALDYFMRLRGSQRESKGQVARRLLGEFAAGRPADRFAMISFSTLPIPVLGFTHKAEPIQAAISAGNIGRGLAETNIGLALQSALALFEDRPYSGSRVVLLVSDGGDRIDAHMRELLTAQARRLRVAIDWIYVRSANSPGLQPDRRIDEASVGGIGGQGGGADDAVPEHFLHRFFESIGVPYQAYEADNPQALQAAIDDLGRLQNLPISYLETVPRRELAGIAWALALGAVLLLLAAQALELRQ